jgi:hypothetical protein
MHARQYSPFFVGAQQCNKGLHGAVGHIDPSMIWVVRRISFALVFIVRVENLK